MIRIFLLALVVSCGPEGVTGAACCATAEATCPPDAVLTVRTPGHESSTPLDAGEMRQLNVMVDGCVCGVLVRAVCPPDVMIICSDEGSVCIYLDGYWDAN